MTKDRLFDFWMTVKKCKCASCTVQAQKLEKRLEDWDNGLKEWAKLEE